MRIPALLLVAALLSACVYKIDIEQGNYVTEDAVANLKTGMTKAEVKQVLGTPLLSDIFHRDRWDYYFANEHRGKLIAHKRLTVLFKDEKLASWSGDANPPRQRPTTPAAPPPGSAPAAPRANVAPPAPPPAPATAAPSAQAPVK